MRGQTGLTADAPELMGSEKGLGLSIRINNPAWPQLLLPRPRTTVPYMAPVYMHVIDLRG